MVLYVGNKLLKHGNTPTTADILPEQLAEYIDIKAVSDKKNIVFRMLDMLFSVYRYKSSLSLIIMDTYSTKNFYYVLGVACLARIFSIPYIPVLHGGNLAHRLHDYKLLSKFIFANAAINIAPSHFLYDLFYKEGFSVEHISNSIELDNYKFKHRKKVRLKLLYVRSFSKVYNPQMALYALAELIKKFPEIELCMVGPDRDGTLPLCKKLAKELNIESHVSFMGKLDKKQWTSLSKDYDIFINTTNFDNMPVSIIEAMALGMIVVSTNVGGIPYLIEDNINGFLIEQNDVEALVDKISFLADSDKLIQDCSLNARTQSSSFDWKVIRNKWLNKIEDHQLDI